MSDKSQMVNNFKSGQTKLTSDEVSDMKVRVYGNTAVITGKADVRGTLPADAARLNNPPRACFGCSNLLQSFLLQPFDNVEVREGASDVVGVEVSIRRNAPGTDARNAREICRRVLMVQSALSRLNVHNEHLDRSRGIITDIDRCAVAGPSGHNLVGVNKRQSLRSLIPSEGNHPESVILAPHHRLAIRRDRRTSKALRPKAPWRGAVQHLYVGTRGLSGFGGNHNHTLSVRQEAKAVVRVEQLAVGEAYGLPGAGRQQYRGRRLFHAAGCHPLSIRRYVQGHTGTQPDSGRAIRLAEEDCVLRSPSFAVFFQHRPLSVIGNTAAECPVKPRKV